MPRIKLSEHKAKTLVSRALDIPYSGWTATKDTVPEVQGDSFVVKVDQGVKQRFKRGLIALDVPKTELPQAVDTLGKSGYSSFIIEPFHTHSNENERYLSLRRERDGIHVSVSQQGGVNIEDHADSIKELIISETTLGSLANETGLTQEQLSALWQLFDDIHASFLEINPYLIENGSILLLDVALEVDSAAELLVDDWSFADERHAKTSITEEESVVQELDSESPASFNLEVINPDGSIFLLLSGGGASIVVADEFYARGFGGELANYGEYSGNPNQYETERYTTQVIQLLLRSQAPKKILFIGGAVANFTDIKATFTGVIAALHAHKDELHRQEVTVFVRRGGPNQRAGLALLERELKDLGIYGAVHDPSVSIPETVNQALKGFSS